MDCDSLGVVWSLWAEAFVSSPEKRKKDPYCPTKSINVAMAAQSGQYPRNVSGRRHRSLALDKTLGLATVLKHKSLESPP